MRLKEHRLTGQAEARLVEVTNWLMSELLLLLLLLLGRRGLHRRNRGHHLRSHGHLTHWPVVLAPGDSSQLCELNKMGNFVRENGLQPTLHGGRNVLNLGL